MHLDDETLRAWLDHQPGTEGAGEHLDGCAVCRERRDELSVRSARVAAHLSVLDPDPADAPRPAPMMYAQFSARRFGSTGAGLALHKENLSMWNRIFTQRLRPLWVGVLTLALVTVALSVPSVRALASDLLARLRVQRVTVVEVTNNRLNELNGNSALGKQIGQLISDSTKVTKEPGKSHVVTTAAEASRIAGFTVRAAGSRTDTPEITVREGGAFEFVVNRARAQTLLDEAGAANIKLPASVDGTTVKVTTFAGVTLAYGTCPRPDEPTDIKTSAYRRYANCAMLVETPSPSADTPADLDVKALAELGLQFSGMTPDQARAFAGKIDWTSTLVIPVPRSGATYKEVSVDGTSGYLIQRTGEAPQYEIVWVKNGIIYAVGGFGTDTAAALTIANSLK